MIYSLLALFLKTAVSVMNLLIVIRCVLSFIPHNPYNSILRYVYEITDLVMAPCSRFMPDALRYPLDFTPIVALVLIEVVYTVLMRMIAILF